MKKSVSAFVSLFIACGLHATAQEALSTTSATDGVNTQPPPEKTILENSEPSDAGPKANIKDNLYYGGYINLSFGSYMVIGIEPMLGYRWTPELSIGVKARYDYIRDDRYGTSYSTSTYGGSLFARYRVTPQFYAQIEPASYSYESRYSDRDWVPFIYLGGGFIQPLGERSWLNVQIMFDVLQNDKSPYDDWEPFFSIGVGTGF